MGNNERGGSHPTSYNRHWGTLLLGCLATPINQYRTMPLLFAESNNLDTCRVSFQYSKESKIMATLISAISFSAAWIIKSLFEFNIYSRLRSPSIYIWYLHAFPSPYLVFSTSNHRHVLISFQHHWACWLEMSSGKLLYAGLVENCPLSEHNRVDLLWCHSDCCHS